MINQTEQVSKARYRTGWGITILMSALLALDGVMKLVKPPEIIRANLELGFAEHLVAPIGIVLLACTLLYLIPRTAIWGALLLTAYLGGAMATHVRTESALFPKTFTVMVAVLIWAGIVLRNRPLEKLLFSADKP
jgi:DoxX-like family